MNRDTTQRGSILIYTLLSMAVMLAIGITLNSLFISRLRAAGSARAALVALYAADSATESCLYQARLKTPDSALTMDNGSTYAVVDVLTNTDVTGDCSVLGRTFQFRATGTFGGSSRALEISQ